MKALKIVNQFILALTVFLIVFVSPFVDFSATKPEEIINFDWAKYFIPQIVLGVIFGIVGVMVILINHKIFKNILLFTNIIIALVISGLLGSKFFLIWNIAVLRGILPLVFMVIFLFIESLVIVRSLPSKSFDKVKVNNSVNDDFIETLVQDDLKTKISNLKTNLSKPSFEILEEIDSTGSFSGISIENIIKKEDENQNTAPEKKEIKIDLIKPDLPETKSINPENSEIVSRPEYDYNDLTELSFEQNKTKEDFEIIKSRRNDSKNKKITPVEVDDE
ncbi:hypothetical protein [Spiroplasma alleghenense]|uniref:Transmembrane protein n=1 Tax=Spiroplasma alleghenense TaxID=216931 RepID=A0A345Z2L5_9MOLU|nr:hypothetical protein [Spiroplasma alleghenense]AXK50844.1 hypothetical protein SALLE_v1c01680 [Spiroplasma alleghenense]